MVREQTFVVTITQPYKDGCGEVVPALNEGDIRSALWKGLPVESRSISVEECGDMGTVR